MSGTVQTTQIDSATGGLVEQKSSQGAALVVLASLSPALTAIKSASSGNVANAVATAALAAVAARTNYCSGISVDVGGATAGSIVLVTLAGVIGGTLTFPVAVPTGVLLVQQLSRAFNPPLQATAVNTAITLSCPAAGPGNTNSAANITGYDVA